MLWRMLLIIGVLLTVVGPMACCPSTPGNLLELRGVFLDGTTTLPLAGATFTSRTFTDGEETDFTNSIHRVGAEQSDEDGNFLTVFSNGPFACDPVVEFPFPDEIELVISYGECRYEVTIPINDETMEIGEAQTREAEGFPAIVLKNPVVVPPCEE